MALAYTYQNMVRFIVTQGEGAAENPYGNRIIEWSPAAHGKRSSRSEPHGPETSAQLSCNADGLNGTCLIFLHVS
jgi:hypothetical protein